MKADVVAKYRKPTAGQVSAHFIALGLLLGLFWYALAGGEGWWFAVPTIAAVLPLSHWLIRPQAGAFSPWGLLRFAAYFLRRSVIGGIDVAWRAMHPGLPLDIHYHEHRFLGPDNAARTLLIATLSLMPGTLSVNYQDGRLLLHSIAGDASQDVVDLEARCRAVFPGNDEGPS